MQYIATLLTYTRQTLIIEKKKHYIQINSDGRLLEKSEFKYLWLDRSLLGDIGNVPSTDLLPTIATPLSTTSMTRLLSLSKIALKHNFISGLLVMAGGVMSLHYLTLTKLFAGCPTVVCLGPAETGKTTSIKAALSLMGMFYSL